MKYISAEEFLKQPKQVQKVFLNWWQPEFGDLFLDDYSDCDSMINIVGCVPINKKHFEDYNGDIHYKTELTIPLLTEGQLRQFIEDKTECKIEIEYTSNLSCYDMYFCMCNTEFEVDYPYNPYRAYTDNLLQALWQVACQIAQE